MSAGRDLTICILSDVHYAAPAEQCRGSTELEVIANPFLRAFVKGYRHFLWRREPYAHNYLLDNFITEAAAADYVVGNGDYSCDSAFIGVSDDAACESARDCLFKLRTAFGTTFLPVLGDHELGKMSLIGGKGGMRLASWYRAQDELALQPFWRLDFGHYTLIAMTSSLVALPIFEHDTLPDERGAWQELRRHHMAQIQNAFKSLPPAQRVVLFTHDPTALPFLWNDLTVRSRISQVEATVIGHLHSELFLWKSRLLAGMPTIRFLGNSIRRMSAALHDARLWRHFKVRLCPSLAGIELLKDGGFCRMRLDPSGARPLQAETVRLPWRQSERSRS